ncbi:hypothetical protein L1077_21845 [Pseudoalteromonas luteoviolacea]|uniref:hypothetical protein n=1 Tax=Pseudoalteromonas luteoviolacea TaxID=43657 RepID=UPI001F3B7BFC|nr:hypothetical protein [Pseudoalteromonas luteoviolacea]MCF6442076.1 hypothetical protein [Pseudoalteromonas luteoviolacea]
MSKSCVFATVLSSIFILSACSEPTAPVNLADFTQKLHALNWFMSGSQESELDKAMPYDELYLSQRHALLDSINAKELSQFDASTIMYLKIQQRYPERYLSWPVQTNVLALSQAYFSPQEIDTWLLNVKRRLEDGAESNIHLSRIEKSQLMDYLSDSDHQSDTVNVFKAFLTQYKTRSGIGLSQLPNGTEWYQSKLNYYTGTVHAPHDFLRIIQDSKKEDASKVAFEWRAAEFNKPFVLAFLEKACQYKSGLNWRDHFIDIRETFSRCEYKLDNDNLYIAAIVAEVDLGVHAFSWSQQQAMHRLQSKLALDEAQAYALLKNIVFYPASIFVLLEQFMPL